MITQMEKENVSPGCVTVVLGKCVKIIKVKCKKERQKR